MKIVKTSLAASLAALTAATLLSACSPLSDDAKKIAGNYYIPEISQDEPLFELRRDGTCTIRAIKPQVLTYSVNGRWNVVNDSLVATLDPATLKWTGDSSLIGDIPARYARRIVGSSDLTLTTEHNNVEYVYHRRPE